MIASNKRIINQLNDIGRNPSPNWTIEVKNQKRWICTMTIYQFSCPFHSIPFQIKIDFPQDYPYSKPHLKFTKPELIFHPNIGLSGEICEATVGLNQPLLKVRDRIDALMALMSNPNANSPLNRLAAGQYKGSIKQYHKKASGIFRGFEEYPKQTEQDLLGLMAARQRLRSREVILNQPLPPIVANHTISPMISSEQTNIIGENRPVTAIKVEVQKEEIKVESKDAELN